MRFIVLVVATASYLRSSLVPVISCQPGAPLRQPLRPAFLAQEPVLLESRVRRGAIMLGILWPNSTLSGPLPATTDPLPSRREPMTQAVANWFVARGWAARCSAAAAAAWKVLPDRRGLRGLQLRCACSRMRRAACTHIEAVTPALIAQPLSMAASIAVAVDRRAGALQCRLERKAPRGASRRQVRRRLGEQDLPVRPRNQPHCPEACRYLGTAVTLALWRKGSLSFAGGHEGQFRHLPFSGWQSRVARLQAAEWNGHEIDHMPQGWTADMEAYLAERGLPPKHAN